MSRKWVIVVVMVMVVARASSARADATLFIGTTTTPENRLARGFSVGGGFVVIGFEGEYSYTVEDTAAAAPGIRTFMGNVLLQTPTTIFGFQPYFTTGWGVYHETLGAYERTAFAPNTGGGVKISLFGPIRLRVDYRALRLGSGALYSPAHRFYAGLNLKF